MADTNSWNFYGNTGGLAVKSKYLESSAEVAEEEEAPTSETEEEENQQASPPAENPDDAGNYNP